MANVNSTTNEIRVTADGSSGTFVRRADWQYLVAAAE